MSHLSSSSSSALLGVIEAFDNLGSRFTPIFSDCEQGCGKGNLVHPEDLRVYKGAYPESKTEIFE
jgi:hypothetical protein